VQQTTNTQVFVRQKY